MDVSGKLSDFNEALKMYNKRADKLQGLSLLFDHQGALNENGTAKRNNQLTDNVYRFEITRGDLLHSKAISDKKTKAYKALKEKDTEECER